MSGLFMDAWGMGEPVVLVHGSLAAGMEELAAQLPLVPVVRRGRPPWHSVLPLAELAAAPFPKLVVSGGHSAGFEAVCDDLSERIGASRAIVAGAGHEVQFTGKPLNDMLLTLWRANPQRRAESTLTP